MSLKDDLLAVADLDVTLLDIPEWPDELYIRVLTGTERAEWQVFLAAQPEDAPNMDVLVKFLGYALCDSEGGRVLDEDDLPGLKAKNGIMLIKASTLALRLNGMSDEAVEEEVKNSAPSTSADSTSG